MMNETDMHSAAFAGGQKRTDLSVGGGGGVVVGDVESGSPGRR